MEPCLEIDEVKVAVQDISYEFGNVDHIHKVGGVWDGEEIKFHMLSGLLPEVTYADEVSGKHPKRLTTTVLFNSREKFWFADHEDKPEEWSENVHMFEFESPMTDYLSWGLRNFNKVIKTP